MKQYIDHNGSLPEPAGFPPEGSILCGSRREMGQQLLSWFLADGIFRGVDPGGRVFRHKTATRLTQAFLEGLNTINIRGYQNLKN